MGRNRRRSPGSGGTTTPNAGGGANSPGKTTRAAKRYGNAPARNASDAASGQQSQPPTNGSRAHTNEGPAASAAEDAAPPDQPPRVLGAKELGDTRQQAKISEAEFKSANEQLAGLLSVIDAVIGLKNTARESKKAYEQATERYQASKRKSDFEVVLETLDSMIGLGEGAVGVYKSIHALLDHARDARQAWESAKALGDAGWAPPPSAREHLLDAGGKAGGDLAHGMKEGVDAGLKGAKLVGGGSGDGAKDLADTNAENLQRAQRALASYTEESVKLKFVEAAGHARMGRLQIGFVAEDLQNYLLDGAIFDEESLTSIESAVENASEEAGTYLMVLEEARQLWNAYLQGGSEGLKPGPERDVFDLVAEWARTGDEQVGMISVAADDVAREHEFAYDLLTLQRSEGGRVWNYWCHAYQSETVQEAEGTVFVNDPKVAEQLLSRGLKLEMFEEREGDARRMLANINPDAIAFKCSVGLAKALLAAGAGGIRTPAEVRFRYGSHVEYTGRPEEGAWSDAWWETPEFASFWSRWLAGQSGWLYDKDNDRIHAFTAGASRQQVNRRPPLDPESWDDPDFEKGPSRPTPRFDSDEQNS